MPPIPAFLIISLCISTFCFEFIFKYKAPKNHLVSTLYSLNFLFFDEFINTHKIQVMQLKYFGLISVLQYNCNAHFSKETGDTITPDSFLHTFLKSDKDNRLIYKKLLSTKSTSPVKSQLKWKNSFAFEENWIPDWKAAYGLAAKCTKAQTS